MSRKIKWFSFLTLLVASFLMTASFAQDQQPSKVDIFTGYSWLHPGGSVAGTKIQDIPSGFNVSTAYFFNRFAGFTVDSGAHFGPNANVAEIQGGPIVRFPTENVTPFIHAEVGWHRLSPDGFGDDNGVGILAGGGMDLRALPHVGIRLFQADYQYAHHNFGFGNRPNLSGARLSTGLVFHLGSVGPPPQPATAACSVQPTEVFAGEPVTATANGSNFNPKRTTSYAWSGTGVKVSGTGSSVQIDTNGLQPGSYAVAANLTDGSKKGIANCTASFTVKQPRPPTISCSANPSTTQPGGTSTISSSGNSPDGRKLTYNYSASAGTISGTDASATLNTAGAQPGPITVTCSTSDDRNLSASSTTTVNVEAPPPPPPPPTPPQSSKLNSITFKKNSPRVDNAAKAILDDVALRLQREADSRAVLVGQAATGERGAKKLAVQRAQNTKTYLVKEKGIDPSRIEVRSGGEGTQQTDIWLVPAGATFSGDGTEVVPDAPARPARRAAKTAKAPKTAK